MSLPDLSHLSLAEEKVVEEKEHTCIVHGAQSGFGYFYDAYCAHVRTKEHERISWEEGLGVWRKMSYEEKKPYYDKSEDSVARFKKEYSSLSKKDRKRYNIEVGYDPEYDHHIPSNFWVSTSCRCRKNRRHRHRLHRFYRSCGV